MPHFSEILLSYVEVEGLVVKEISKRQIVLRILAERRSNWNMGVAELPDSDTRIVGALV